MSFRSRLAQSPTRVNPGSCKRLSGGCHGDNSTVGIRQSAPLYNRILCPLTPRTIYQSSPALFRESVCDCFSATSIASHCFRCIPFAYSLYNHNISNALLLLFWSNYIRTPVFTLHYPPRSTYQQPIITMTRFPVVV